jgi:hypothetical protein
LINGRLVRESMYDPTDSVPLVGKDVGELILAMLIIASHGERDEVSILDQACRSRINEKRDISYVMQLSPSVPYRPEISRQALQECFV